MKIVSIVLFNITDGHGTDRAVVNLANSLVRFGEYKVNIISCLSKKDDISYFELHKTVELYNLGFSLSLKKEYFSIIKRIAAICKVTKTDYLLGTTHALNSILPFVKCKRLRRIGCEHMNYGAAPLYSKLFRRLTYPYLDGVVLLTEADRIHYSFCKNTYVIPNCVQILSKSSTCENKIMLAVGRYTKQKGFDMLIDAFALIHSECHDWVLRIVGGGEDEDLLKAKIHEHKLESCVQLVPPTKSIKDEYLRAGMYVLSSRWEGFVLVLTEAKAAGLPAVSFNCPEGPADILNDGRDGFLVPPEDIEELAKRMKQLAMDESLRKAFGQAAKEDIKRLSPEIIFQIWDNLFKGFV